MHTHTSEGVLGGEFNRSFIYAGGEFRIWGQFKSFFLLTVMIVYMKIKLEIK